MGNVLKQNAIAPPPTDPEMATEEESGRGERSGADEPMHMLACLHTYAGMRHLCRAWQGPAHLLSCRPWLYLPVYVLLQLQLIMYTPVGA